MEDNSITEEAETPWRGRGFQPRILVDLAVTVEARFMLLRLI